ncbi:exosortase family protein XrtF [bacterium]|nr:exosortase family protein XrtF [bacterium]
MQSNLKLVYQQNKEGFRFILKMIAIYAILSALYHWGLSPYTSIDSELIHIIIAQSEWILSGLGYELISNPSQAQFLMGIQGSSGVIIGGPCDGLSLFILYATFIFSFHGRWWMKGLSIAVGVIIIHSLNVLRVTALALIVVYAPDQLDFHHSYTFTLFVYGIVFLLWMWRIKIYQWIKK